MKATRKGDPVWLEATKHERALLTALGNKCGIPRETRNKKVLDVDYKKRQVYFGKCVAGEYPDSGGFRLNVEVITSEATRLGMKFTGEDVRSEYTKSISE